MAGGAYQGGAEYTADTSAGREGSGAPTAQWGPSPTTWANYEQDRYWNQENGPYVNGDPRNAKYAPNYSNTYNQYINDYTSQMNGAFDQRAAALSAQKGALGGYDAQMGYARKDNDIALRRLALREEGNGYDIGLARQQLGFADEGLQIDRDRVGAGKSYLDKLRGFATADYSQRMGFIGQQRGFASRGRDLNLADIGLNYDRQSRLATSDATGRGAATSQGFKDTIGEYGRERDIGTGKANLGYDTTMADLGNQEYGAGAELRDKNAQYDKQIGDLDFDLRTSELSAKDKKATLDNRLKQMDILGRDFGLQREELMNTLNKGLASLGMQRDGALAQIMDAMASNEVGRQSAALEVITAAKNAADSAINSGQATPNDGVRR